MDKEELIERSKPFIRGFGHLISAIVILVSGAYGVEFIYAYTPLMSPTATHIVSEWSIVLHFLLIGLVGGCVYLSLILLGGVYSAIRD